ncbi:MAG: HPF/RaiA family ribosome-associated protein [Gammaproteobacteria bacterium]
MNIDIRTRGFELTEALRRHAERRVRFALDWAGDYVRTVSLRFSDINGPRGGNDKRCQLQIALPRMRAVVIEDTAADLYLAIDHAVDRASRTLRRRLSRHRTFAPGATLADGLT